MADSVYALVDPRDSLLQERYIAPLAELPELTEKDIVEKLTSKAGKSKDTSQE